jgi:hypothetical protein
MSGIHHVTAIAGKAVRNRRKDIKAVLPELDTATQPS